MIKAKTIEIYLPTGDASKVSIARITTEAIKVIYMDKSEIDKRKEDLNNIGCYILVGLNTAGEKTVYIGESENVYIRLQDHKKKKDFWSGVYAIQNLSGTFDKAHLTYLEQLMISKAVEADRFNVENGNGGKYTAIPESKKYECLVYFETIKTLVKSLGFNVFVPEIEKDELANQVRFYFQSKDNLWDAQGVFVDEKFVVLKGSIARTEPVQSKSGSNQLKFKEKLMDEGIIVESNGKHIFAKDYSFNSPSLASDIVSLSSTNGWDRWRTKAGKSLDEIFPRIK
jgi:hypothetical protein